MGGGNFTMSVHCGFVSVRPTTSGLVGDSVAAYDLRPAATQDTASSNAVITEIGWYKTNSAATGSEYVGLYSAISDGVPGNLLASATSTDTAQANGWKYVATNNIPITAGSYYWISILNGNGSANTAVLKKNTGLKGGGIAGTDVSTFPSTWNTSTGQYWNVSAGDGYCIYALTSTAQTTKSTSVSDSFSSSDTFYKSGNFIKGLVDTGTLTDTFNKSGVFVKSLSDNITLTEALSTGAILIHNKSLEETITLSENLNIEGDLTFNISVSDAVTLSETLTITGLFHTGTNDTATLSDTFYISKVAQKSITEELTFTDSSGKTINFIKSVTETITLIEAFSIEALLASDLYLSEILNIADTFSRGQFIGYRNYSDTLTISDSFVGAISGKWPIYEQESISLTEAINLSGIFNYYKSLSESVTLTDNFYREFIGSKGFSDTITIIDTFGANWSTARNYSDSISFSEYIYTQAYTPGTLYKYVSDSASLSDSASIERALKLKKGSMMMFGGKYRQTKMSKVLT